jgi:hypothetical protein
MNLVGYGTFKLEGGRLIVKFMSSNPFDFSTWEVEIGDRSINLVEILQEKLNGHVIIKDWKKETNEGVFGVYC